MVASTARYNLGVALAYRGRHDDAVTLLTMTMQEKNVSDWDLQRGHGGLGFTALSSGDAALAIEHLTEWHTLLRAMNFREPGYSRSHLDFVEALVATGRMTQAEEFLDELDDQVLTFRAAIGGGDRHDRTGPDPSVPGRHRLRRRHDPRRTRLLRDLAFPVRPGPYVLDCRPHCMAGAGSADGT